MTPFSNGTEAMIWYGNNCEVCTKAYFPKDGEYPSDKTMKRYCKIGKECKLKYAIDWSFVSGEIPDDVAAQIGTNKFGLKETCMMFSDDEDNRYKPPHKPIDNIPDNQLMLFSIADDILEEVKVPTEAS